MTKISLTTYIYNSIYPSFKFDGIELRGKKKKKRRNTKLKKKLNTRHPSMKSQSRKRTDQGKLN